MESREPKTEKPLSNRERVAIKDELITELVAGCQNDGDLFGPEGVFSPQRRGDAAPAGVRDDRPPRARAQRAAEGQYSLIESAKLAGVEPDAYLRTVARHAIRAERIPLPHELVAS